MFLKVSDPVLDDPFCIRKLFYFLICVKMIPGNAQIWLELGRAPWSLYHLYSEPGVPNNAIMVATHEVNLSLPTLFGIRGPKSQL